ncbi:hypothetical protein DPMN_053176 [Dreissena polymorpha]|uniref:Uncharacterized protein n=1 Tax=Dreissena polymorpha TaxID=45954 RepID=A0A9D4CM49_DREPO|nr:hypothetical protein DPMN_053176 [Dreissena polymorpha]
MGPFERNIPCKTHGKFDCCISDGIFIFGAYLPISSEFIEQFENSLKVDLMSARLKYASLLLNIEQVDCAAKILFDIEASLPSEVYEFSMHLPAFRTPGPELVKTITEESITAAVQAHVASCVIYTPLEVNCGPTHLAYEMYRTITEDDKRDRLNIERWMDCAVTDSIPYLYYLQYLVYKRLGSNDKAKTAISKLRNKISDVGENMCCKENPVMNRHLETSFNLLGNCYELEGNLEHAWDCYSMSVTLCPRNNAARWHMLVMLMSFYQLFSK